MAPYLGNGKSTRTSSMAALLIVAAILYLARDVLVPFALAILLAFQLAPAVRRLERWKLGRVLSTFIVVVFGFSLIGAVGYLAGLQAVSLVAKLPEYRANITEKIGALKRPGDGKIAKAHEAIKDLEKQADPTPQDPMPVTETPKSAYAQLLDLVAPFAKPLGMALAVVVFTILLLLHRESMREKLIGLIGPRRINVTTQAAVPLVLLLTLFAAALGAQGYPSRPVRVIVPFSPGGVTDIIARTHAAKLADLWGKAVVVGNRPGAGGSLGAAVVARAAADGHLLLVHSSGYADQRGGEFQPAV